MLARIPLLTLALPLAAVSVLLIGALVWQARAAVRLQRQNDHTDYTWLISSAVVLCIGHLVLVACYLWLVATCMQYGINPSLVTDPQVCPPPSPQEPSYPCDPLMGAVAAVSDIQLMSHLLVLAPICCGLSLLVLLVGMWAIRRHRQQATVTVRSE